MKLNDLYCLQIPFCFEFLYIFRKENLEIHETFMHQKKSCKHNEKFLRNVTLDRPPTYLEFAFVTFHEPPTHLLLRNVLCERPLKMYFYGMYKIGKTLEKWAFQTQKHHFEVLKFENIKKL